LRAIKEKGGVVLVQGPRTAKFAACRAARLIRAGGHCRTVETCREEFSAYLKRTPLRARPDRRCEDKTQSALEKAIILLRARSGHDFFASTKKILSTGASNGAWASIRSSRSLITSVTCRKISQDWTAGSRNC